MTSFQNTTIDDDSINMDEEANEIRKIYRNIKENITGKLEKKSKIKIIFLVKIIKRKPLGIHQSK